MPTSVLENITANVLATLATITTANGYTYTLSAEREKRYGNTPKDKLVVVKQGDPQPLPDSPGMALQWSQPYYLDIHVQIPEDQNDSLIPSTVLNAICADIHKALLVDRTRGNFSLDTQIAASQEWLVQQGDFDGRTFNFNVNYRTLETDPFTVVS